MTGVALPLADDAGNILIDPVRVASIRSLPLGVVAVKMDDGTTHKISAASVNDVSGALMVKRHG